MSVLSVARVTSFMRPWHLGQVRMSVANTLRRSHGQGCREGGEGEGGGSSVAGMRTSKRGSCSGSSSTSGDALGTTSDRTREWGARTPRYLSMWNRGGGTRARRRARKSRGSRTASFVDDAFEGPAVTVEHADHTRVSPGGDLCDRDTKRVYVGAVLRDTRFRAKEDRMSHKTAEQEHSNDFGVLYVALELGGSRWWLASSDGSARAPRLKSVAAGDLEGLELEWGAARRRFGLSPDARVRSCYEAGRDGFWVHRALVRMRVDNHVVDSSSIEVNRRHRRAKTDRLDARRLLKLLLRFCQGESDVWSVVRVPSEASEDDRRAGRERASLKKEATRLGNRLRALLKTQGCDLKGSLKGFDLSLVRDWEGKPSEAASSPRTGSDLRALDAVLSTTSGTGGRAEGRTESTHSCHEEGRATDDTSGNRTGDRLVARDRALCLAAVSQPPPGRCEPSALTGTPYRSDGTVREQGISKAGRPSGCAVSSFKPRGDGFAFSQRVL